MLRMMVFFIWSTKVHKKVLSLSPHERTEEPNIRDHPAGGFPARMAPRDAAQARSGRSSRDRMRRMRPPSAAPGTSLSRKRRDVRLSSLPAPGPARRAHASYVGALLQGGQDGGPARSPVTDFIFTSSSYPIPRPARTFLCISVLFYCKSGKYVCSYRGCTSHANPAARHRRGAQRGDCLW